MWKEIYDGSIAIASDAYLECVSEEGDETPIAGLDEVVARRSLRFELEYPFDRSYVGTIAAANGVTLRRIIDAVRSAFREMYAGTTERELAASLVNREVEGAYGRACHVISDLVIESLAVDEGAGLLDVNIGS